MKTDEVDLNIISMLQENGRTTNKEIARTLGLSEGTIGNRIEKLLKANLLKIAGLINPFVYPEKQCVYLAIRIALNKLSVEIAEKIRELPPVRSTSIITGQFDILVETFINTANLIEFLTQDLAKIEGIVSVESFVSLKCFNKWI